MSSTNPSAPFGYYGGIPADELYVPPPAKAFYPPPKSLTFTQENLQTLQTLLSSGLGDFLMLSGGAILFRSLSSTDGEFKTFKIENLNNFLSSIQYTTSLSSIQIAVLPTSTPQATEPQATSYIYPPTPEATSMLPPTPEATPEATPYMYPPTPEATETP